MSEAEDEQTGDSGNAVPQLYVKDENSGEFVPVAVESAEGNDSGQFSRIILSAEHMHSGPLPSVETFREYGEVVADAPERILRMAEKEQDASHEFTRSAIGHEKTLVSQGQWMGFITMLVALLGGIGITLAGHPWVGAALVSPAVLTAIMRFYFKGHHEVKSEPQDKTEG